MGSKIEVKNAPIVNIAKAIKSFAAYITVTNVM